MCWFINIVDAWLLLYSGKIGFTLFRLTDRRCIGFHCIFGVQVSVFSFVEKRRLSLYWWYRNVYLNSKIHTLSRRFFIWMYQEVRLSMRIAHSRWKWTALPCLVSTLTACNVAKLCINIDFVILLQSLDIPINKERFL